MNSTSIGVECCHYPMAYKDSEYYSAARRKKTGNLPHKVVRQPIAGGYIRNVFSFTEEAVDSLARLTAGCWFAVGQQRSGGFYCEYDSPPEFPRESFDVPYHKIRGEPKNHIGLIGHRHCSDNKWDPAGLDFEKLERLTEDYYTGFRAVE